MSSLVARLELSHAEQKQITSRWVQNSEVKMKALASSITELSPGDISTLVEGGTLNVMINKEAIRIDINDVEIISEEVGDWSVAQDGSLTIAIDAELTEELRLQGCARELVNRIQSMRKSADLNLTAKIIVNVNTAGETYKAIEEHTGFIKRETLADEINTSLQSKTSTWNDTFTINGDAVTIGGKYCKIENYTRKARYFKSERLNLLHWFFTVALWALASMQPSLAKNSISPSDTIKNDNTVNTVYFTEHFAQSTTAVV